MLVWQLRLPEATEPEQVVKMIQGVLSLCPCQACLYLGKSRCFAQRLWSLGQGHSLVMLLPLPSQA